MLRDHRGIIFASLYTIIKNKTGDIFLSGQNQYHITGVKKSYFCHTFHLRPKKVFWWVVGGGWWWKVTLVSVCVHFLKLLNTQTQKWTQSLTTYFWCLGEWPLHGSHWKLFQVNLSLNGKICQLNLLYCGKMFQWSNYTAVHFTEYFLY